MATLDLLLTCFFGWIRRAERRQSRGSACPRSAHRLAQCELGVWALESLRRRVTFGAGKVVGGVSSWVLPPPCKDGSVESTEGGASSYEPKAPPPETKFFHTPLTITHTGGSRERAEGKASKSAEGERGRVREMAKRASEGENGQRASAGEDGRRASEGRKGQRASSGEDGLRAGEGKKVFSPRPP